MSNTKGREDKDYNRLSSFLFTEGMLELQKITSIKSNVLYVETITGDRLILKGHTNKNNVEQQWNFFTQMDSPQVVPFKRYPNGLKLLADAHYYWTISPYIQGRKLNFDNASDRRCAVETLHDFHKSAQHTFIKNTVVKRIFYERWYNRLLSFKETSYIFDEHHFKLLYKDIVQTTEVFLQLVARFPWHQMDSDAANNGKWVHGDVASHNFIQNEYTYLIDFDLLSSTSQLHDYIQLGQRFLPYVNWDLEQLLDYRMVTENDLKKWLCAILIPSDVLREWLHFLRQESTMSVDSYLSEMEESWMQRRLFLKKASLMLKSKY